MLKIYNASAGAGKTHTLTNEYLYLIFNNRNFIENCDKDFYPLKFSRILAITFTNKATAEIKERVLQRLEALSNGDFEKNADLVLLLNENLNLEKKQIKNCAKKILRSIVHNYSFFNISTIDSFFQTVLRNFALELKLKTNYTVELDLDKIVSDITDLFFQSLFEKEKDLVNDVINFALEKLSEGKDWNIRNDFKNMLFELFKEKNVNHILKIKNIDFQKLSEFKKLISEQYAKILNEFQNVALDLLQYIENNFEDAKKVKPLKTFLTKIVENQKIEVSSKKIKKFLNLEDDEFFQILDKKTDQLSKLQQLYNQYFELFNTIKLIKNNLTIYSFTNQFIEIIKQYKRDNNIIILSEVPIFLKEVMNNEQIPIIYEKLGTIIDNVMIDEFQDTSKFQWINFIPLIEESIARGNKSLIVGDPKQSLYRWRNGDYKILLYDIDNQFSSENLEKVNLEYNWRSGKNIVEFNNKLFSKFPEFLYQNLISEFETENFNQDLKNDISNAYQNVIQKPKKNFGGKVKITFLKNFRSKEDNLQILSSHLFPLIEELLEKYDQKDICILTRKNNEIITLFNELTTYFQNTGKKINLISDESLNIINSQAIRIILLALNRIANPDEDFYLQSLVYILAQKDNLQKEITLSNNEQLLKKLKLDIFEAQKNKFQNTALFELTEAIISIFELNKDKKEIPFIRTFQNLIYEFSNKYGNDLNEFLFKWERGDFSDLSIDLPEEADAIKLMTIHKAKGLSFKVVILPFVNWELGYKANSTVIWAEPQKINDDLLSKSPLDVFPISLNKTAQNSYFIKDYYQELMQSYLDSINLLYVAFTRPIYELHAFAQISDSTIKKKNNPKKIGDALYLFMDKNFELKKEQADISFEIDDNFKVEKTKTNKNIFQLDQYPNLAWKEKIAIKTHAKEFFEEKIAYREEAITFGNIMHEIMAEAKNYEQALQISENMFIDGIIDLPLKLKIQTELKKIFNNQFIKDWFSDKWLVKTEESIITKKGEVKRPDRILISKNEIIVIDYKFGQEKPEHYEQVKEYMQLLKEIETNKQIKGFLFYALKNLVKEVLVD